MTFQCPPLVTIRLWENRCSISISASQMVLCFREWFYQACLLPRDPSSDLIFSFMRTFFSFMRLFSFMRICCYSFPTDLLKEYNLEANVTHFFPVHRMFFFSRGDINIWYFCGKQSVLIDSFSHPPTSSLIPEVT